MQHLNCGIIGGRPREAYYLVGMQEDSLIFLDPHNTQPAISNDKNSIKRNMLKSYHESNAKKINYSKIEPTMTFGFYLRSFKDYKKLKLHMDSGKKLFGDKWIFSCLEEKPDYLRIIDRSNSEEFEDLSRQAKMMNARPTNAYQ